MPRKRRIVYEQHYAGPTGWSEWIYPHPQRYRLACCDCGLVHRMQYRVKDGVIEYRCRRDNRATGQIRRHRGKGPK